MIKKISKAQQKCDTEYIKMINNKIITIDNQFTDDNLNNIKEYKNSTDEGYHFWFKKEEELLEKIKQFNFQVTNIKYNELNNSMNNNNKTITNQQHQQHQQHQLQQEMLQKIKIIQAQELKLLNDIKEEHYQL